MLGVDGDSVKLGWMMMGVLDGDSVIRVSETSLSGPRVSIRETTSLSG